MRPEILPVHRADQVRPELLGFLTTGTLPAGAAAYLVRDGVRVARLTGLEALADG